MRTKTENIELDKKSDEIVKKVDNIDKQIELWTQVIVKLLPKILVVLLICFMLWRVISFYLK